MKNTYKLGVLCLAVSLGLSACGGNNKDAESSQAEAALEKIGQAVGIDNIVVNEKVLQAAEDSLKALPQFNGKPLNVFQNVRFYSNRIEIDIQDPNNPENIDSYIYSGGKWSEPTPVQISGGGDLKDNTTPLDQIKFATVAKIAKIWHEKAVEVEAEETELDFATFSLFVPMQKRRWIVSDIETDRAKYGFEFDANGNLKEFKKE